MNITDLSPGQQAKVIGVVGQGPVRQRILDMGIIPEVFIKMERVAPIGDTVWVRLRGFQLSLRAKEAQSVCVEKI